jgi:hypothetical protein
MKTKMCNRIIGLLVTGILFPSLMRAQVAQWNFNNTLNGTGSVNATAKPAVLGSAITLGDYNGGTVYFGEGGWPAGALDPNAYLEFSVSPTSSYSLTISSMVMSIRRSTTGTSGSGPNNWALRSSLDGFAADISNGTLSTNILAIPVTFNASYANLSGTVTFRLYGYNATVSASGGLNRFVYDNISISGSTILPVVFESFKASKSNQAANLTWTLGGEGDIAHMTVERSANGNAFETITEITQHPQQNDLTYSYQDMLTQASGAYAYRIKLISPDGKIQYSDIQQVVFDAPVSFSLESISTGAAGDIRFRLNAEEAGVYQINLYDMNGMKMGVKQINLSAGTQVLTMDNTRSKPGIYILSATHAGQHCVSKIAVL